MRADFSKQIVDLRTDFNKRMELFEKNMENMRADFNKRFSAFDIRLTALGSRWGLENEAAVRNAIKGLYEKKFGVTVKRWEYFDEEGLVFNHPSMIEIDVAITNGEHTLIEIKAHVGKSDITELLRSAELYEKVEKVKPKLVVITPFIDDKALELAKIKNISVYSSNELFNAD